jgi:hypothetical protein
MQGKEPGAPHGCYLPTKGSSKSNSSAPISRLPGSSFYWCILKLSTAEQIDCDPSDRLCVARLYDSGVHQQVRPGIGTFGSGFRCSEELASWRGVT